MQTPLVYGGLLYVCRDNGVLSVYDAATGERKYQQRLADGRTGFTASPVAADGKIYFTSEDGDIYVVKAGAAFELISNNAMGEVCMATPAISQATLFFRTRGHLVAIEQVRTRHADVGQRQGGAREAAHVEGDGFDGRRRRR